MAINKRTASRPANGPLTKRQRLQAAQRRCEHRGRVTVRLVVAR